LETIAERDLISAVPSIQLAIRLLIPSRSRLLELPEIAGIVGEFDAQKLVYPWAHSDPAVDALAARMFAIVSDGEKQKLPRAVSFDRIWIAASELRPAKALSLRGTDAPRPVPYLSEPWYC
jgi:hypothetical protein